jgi:hypothetical protein
VELAEPGAAGRARAGTASGLFASADHQRACERQRHESCRAILGEWTGCGGKIEITLPDGTSVKVGYDVGLGTLRRVMTVLRR